MTSRIGRFDKRGPEDGPHEDGLANPKNRAVGKRTRVEEAAANSPLRQLPGLARGGAPKTAARKPTVGKRTRVEEAAARSPRYLVERAYEQGGGSLPAALRAELEAISGQDLGGIRVNTGAEAAEAADAVNARAYTFGSQINFAPGEYDPETDEGQDLIAHEVAHALQQRFATEPHVARRGRSELAVEDASSLSFSSPSQEAEADSFAEAFGSHLGARSLSRTTTMHVARKGKGEKSKKRSKGRVLIATNPVRSTSGVSFEDIAAVAAGKEDESTLGTTWVSSLHTKVRKDIERNFSLSSQDAEFGRRIKKDKELHAAAKAYQKALKVREKEALKEAKTRGEKVRRKKQRKAALEADNAYQADATAMGTTHEQARTASVAEKRTEFDRSNVRNKVTESVIELPDSITREEARLLARLNFVDWGVATLGSEAAAKAHFSAIRGVTGFHGGLLMHADAGQALSNAGALFRKKFPGQRMVDSAGGFSIRNRHQGRHSRGRQGHPLGIAIDFKAYENPHQTDPLKAFLIQRFGGPNPDGSGGTNRMAIPGATAKALRMAKEMKTSGKLSAQSEKDLIGVKKAHNTMVDSSERFKEQLKSERPALRSARQAYLDVVGPATSRISAINKAIKKLRPAAKRAIKKQRKAEYREARDAQVSAAVEAAKAEGLKLSKKRARRQVDSTAEMKELRKASGTVTDEMISAHGSVAPLATEKAKLEADIATQEAALKAAMKTAVKPWVEELSKELAAHGAGLPPGLVDKPPTREKISNARGALPRVAKLVTAFKKAQGKPGKRADQSRAKLRKELEVLLAKFPDVFGSHTLDDTTDLAALYEQIAKLPGPLGEISARNEITKKLESDIRFVFGGRTGAYTKKVADPSIMQLLETGFIRNDPVAPSTGAKPKRGGPKETFNAEFTAIMMQFGFTPGGSWNSSIDTMHYDYQPGYQKLTGGGMRSVKFGPKGTGGKKR